jgi:hypothetical protein
VVERFFREKGAPGGAGVRIEQPVAAVPFKQQVGRLALVAEPTPAAPPAITEPSDGKHDTAEWKKYVETIKHMCGGNRGEFHLFNRQNWRQAVYADKTGLEYWEWVAEQVDVHIEKARQAGYAVVEDTDQPGYFRYRTPDGTVGDVADETEDEAWCRAGLHLEGKEA